MKHDPKYKSFVVVIKGPRTPPIYPASVASQIGRLCWDKDQYGKIIPAAYDTLQEAEAKVKEFEKYNRWWLYKVFDNRPPVESKQMRLLELDGMMDAGVNPIVKEKAKVQPAVNDSQCSSCGNERVNKTEKSCWLCGVKL